MAKHVIEISIKPGGIIESEVLGILGSACEVESQWLDQLGTIKEHRKTRDSEKVQKVELVKKVFV